jgi:hypothetical protein
LKFEAANLALDAVKKLAVKVGIPERLGDLNITENSLEALAKAAFHDVCTQRNPKTVTFEDVLKLYKSFLMLQNRLPGILILIYQKSMFLYQKLNNNTKSY